MWNFLPHLPPLVALAVVACVGYLIGRQARSEQSGLTQQTRRELRRAQVVAGELEKIAGTIRGSLARHQANLERFKQNVLRLNVHRDEASWAELCREAEGILRPTLRLAVQIADSYDQIRQQSAHLMLFTDLRTDPLTGVSNRRAFDESLKLQFAMLNRYDAPFALAVFDIDHFKRVNDENGHLHGDRILQDFAKLLDSTVRETDMVARYGGEEFVIIMPHTDLEGGGLFVDRLRKKVSELMPITVSAGVAAAIDGDSPESLVARADAALYQSKSAGRNCVHRHDGGLIELIQELHTLPAAS